jgi:hypothetical protein
MRLLACSLSMTLLALPGLAKPAGKKPASQPAAKPAAKPAGLPTTAPATDAELRARASIQRVYAELFGKALEQDARLANMIGIVGLSRIDGKPLTDQLMLTFEKHKDPLVRELAWQALYARAHTLEPAVQRRWIGAGLAMAQRDEVFRGFAIRPLLLALNTEEAGRAEAYLTNDALLLRILSENDPANPRGLATLQAAGLALSRAESISVVRKLAAKAGRNAKLAARIAVVLSAYPGVPSADLPERESRSAWAKFASSLDKTVPVAPPSTLATDAFFTPPEAITNSEDPRWRRDLELGNLKVSEVELVFTIDATGSMVGPNKVISEVVPIMIDLLQYASGQTRLGAVYYRHESDPVAMAACCKKATGDKQSFLTKTLQLTQDGNALARDMLGVMGEIEPPKGDKRFGHANGAGAYAAGLRAVIEEVQWSRNETARRFMVLLGDAVPTANSEPLAIERGKQIAKVGIQSRFILKGIGLKGAASIASACGATPVSFATDIQKLDGASASSDSIQFVKLVTTSELGGVSASVLKDGVSPAYVGHAEQLLEIAISNVAAARDARLATAALGENQPQKN